mmetsp:Transcript_27491/g.61425  ORF Transcript_27491/g.61425 Transcript_27491/m.61425 type:complete len:206 (-) Transcript_27491:417-1034(-)
MPHQGVQEGARCRPFNQTSVGAPGGGFSIRLGRDQMQPDPQSHPPARAQGNRGSEDERAARRSEPAPQPHGGSRSKLLDPGDRQGPIDPRDLASGVAGGSRPPLLGRSNGLFARREGAQWMDVVDEWHRAFLACPESRRLGSKSHLAECDPAVLARCTPSFLLASRPGESAGLPNSSCAGGGAVGFVVPGRGGAEQPGQREDCTL